MKDLKYYLNLPYTVVLQPDGEGSVIARVEELPGCATDGPTVPEALERLEELKQAWLEDAIEAGHPVPEPTKEEVLPSRKWVQRVPRSLHRKLGLAAEKEGVSLNALVTSILAEAIGAKKVQQKSAESGIGALIDSEQEQGTGLWHEADLDWSFVPGNLQSIVTVHSAKRRAVELSLEHELQIIGAGLPKNRRKISLKDVYDEKSQQRLGKTC